jgi:hypothetical protein
MNREEQVVQAQGIDIHRLVHHIHDHTQADMVSFRFFLSSVFPETGQGPR